MGEGAKRVTMLMIHWIDDGEARRKEHTQTTYLRARRATWVSFFALNDLIIAKLARQAPDCPMRCVSQFRAQLHAEIAT